MSPRSHLLAGLALATLATSGCGLGLFQPPPELPMNEDESTVANAVADVTAASREAFNIQVSDLPTDVPQAARRLQGLAAPPEAATTDDLYTGPYPAAGALPGGYEVRTPGGWLRMNPSVRTTALGLGVTSTYWTPGGTDQASAAQTVLARAGDAVLQDLYVSPNTAVADVPTYFKDKLALPAAYSVLQAEETYRVYHNGALAGPATGYRWLVLEGDRQSWVRALRVAPSGGAAADHYNVSAAYAMLDGALQPMHTAYGTRFEGTGISYAFQRDTDLAAGVTTGSGRWQDPRTNALLTIDERTDATGACQRLLSRRLNFGELLKVEERYTRGNAGAGTVSINGFEIGTMAWDAKFVGKLKIGAGTASYTASRKSAMQRPAVADIQLRVAYPGWDGTFGRIRHR